jgi:hypothetical protein
VCSRQHAQELTDGLRGNVGEILDREALVTAGVQGRQHIQPLSTRGRFDKQPLKTPDKPQEGGQHNMGGIPEEDGSIASRGCG